jgi:hypothetical protein
MGFIIDKNHTFLVEDELAVDDDVFEDVCVLLLERQDSVKALTDALGLEALSKLIALQVLLGVDL